MHNSVGLNHFDNYLDWEKVQPPFRLNDNIIKQYKQIINKQQSIITLGCTEEFLCLSDKVHAYDISEQQISRYPGNASKLDWRDLKLDHNSVECVIGDNSLNFLLFPHEWIKVIENCKLISKNFVVFRVLEKPRYEVSLKEIVSNLPFSFDCLKLQLFHFLALKNPNVPVKLVYDLFYLLFKKQDLKDKVDWNNIDTIDNYKNSDLIYSLPTEQQILKYFPGAKRKNSYGYSMSECCPFYIF